ncbi:Lysophospholipase L1 [Flaviramulus basaltis]|uniref:Lysophospholipase L1 n=1 Tax=Flaviramulus basaltis TaxID=369401 RepID=A0A1K2INM0_9FLAO|nr:fibronectin type III domain-containing protein [Flaviramulus basaltis]SFZ94045.1 Lysophospholipase L1 [Flaviramulus basaltis]
MKKIIILFLLFSTTVFSQSYYPLDKEPTSPDDEKPSTPLNLVASNIGTTSVNLNWTAATDNIAVIDYAVYNNGVLLIASTGGTQTNYSLTGLSASTLYTLTVRAIDAAGNTSDNSNTEIFTTSTNTTSPDTQNPTAPLNLVASNITETTVDLSWTAATDNIAVTNYNIYNNGNVLIASIENATNYTLTNLTPDTSYNITIQAIDAAGNQSSNSNNQDFTTEAIDTENPTSPLNLVASNVGNTTVDLSWTAATDNVEVTDYIVYNNGGVLVASTGNVTNYKVIGLSTDTLYNLTIRAIDAANNESGDSNNQEFLTTSGSLDCSEILAQTEVDDFENTYGKLSTSDRYAHDYLVSFLKCEGIWDLLGDVSTCLDNNYYKLKNSVAKNNIQSGDTGVNLNQYNYNDISLTLDYNDIVTTTNELINVGSSKLRLLLNTGSYKYTAFHCGNKALSISHDITINTKRTFVLTSNSNNMAVVTKSGHLIKTNNTNNIGTFASENLKILDPSKLNFYASGKGLDIEQSKKLAIAIKEFNKLMARTNYDEEVGSYEFIGNSITYGYEPPSNKINNNYPNLTSTNILGKTDATWNTSNLGVSGIRLDEVLAEIKSYDKYGLLTRNPNVDTYTIVSLGTNDFLQGRTATQVKADLDTYTSILTAAGNKVLVILPHRSTTYTGDNPGNYNNQAPTFISLVEADINYYGGTNAYDTLVFETGNANYDDTTNSTYWYDGLHPKEAYFALMAPIIAPKLEPIDDNVAPSIPTNFLAVNTTSNTVDLTWNASSDNNGITKYKIYNNGNLIATVAGSITNYTLTGLTANTTYELTIRALDAANNESADSNKQTISTTALTSTDNYTLDQSYKTSAGVYDANDNLLRTLYSNQTQTAGTYDVSDFSWDGKSDDGNDVRAQGDHIKVVANNINANWEGVIGNTSTSFTGNTVIRRYEPYYDALVIDNSIFFAHDYSEKKGSVSALALNALGTLVEVQATANVHPATQRIAYDGNMLYMAGRGGNTSTQRYSFICASTIENLDKKNNWHSFLGETISIYSGVYNVCDIVDDPVNEQKVTGLAVQKNGNKLFIAREQSNSLHVLLKNTGVLLQSLAYNSIKHCKVDNNDDLWIVYDNASGDEIVEKFTVNIVTGALTSTGFTIKGLEDIQSMAFSPDGTTIAIADAKYNGAHQVFGYSTNTGTLSWTLGRNESYAADAKVYDDKFMFRQPNEDYYYYGFVAYESDGSLWVGDRGNYRYQRFNTSRVFTDSVMWFPGIYSLNVDANDNTRVFYEFLEFDVDYSLPLQPGNANKAWKLVNNWGAREPIEAAGLSVDGNVKIRDITTLSNGRTYAFMFNGYPSYALLELVNGGSLRNTGITINNSNFKSNLKPDDKITDAEQIYTGEVRMFETPIVGFDGSNNPILGTRTQWGAYGTATVNLTGPHYSSGEITSNGTYIIFDGNQKNAGDYHLAGYRKGDSKLSWKTLKGVVYGENDNYPLGKNTFDAREGVAYYGNKALAMDDWFIWGYNGEGWQDAQTNYWHMLTEDGLFLYDFGTNNIYGSPAIREGMHGNAFTPQLAKVGNDVYLYNNDEGQHGGIGRWKISNINSIKHFKIKLN